MAERYKSLLHFIDKDELENLDIDLINKYSDEWRRQWEKGNTSLTSSFESLGSLNESIETLQHTLVEQKAIFNHKALLKFLESGELTDGLYSDIAATSQYFSSPRVSMMVQNAFVEAIEKSISAKGVRSIQYLRRIKDPFFHLPLNIQDKIENLSRRRINRTIRVMGVAIDEGDLPSAGNYVSRHFKNVLTNLPFEHEELLNSYGKKCELLVRKNMTKYKQQMLNDDEAVTFEGAAIMAGEILQDKDLLALGKQAKDKRMQKPSTARKLLTMAGWALLLIVVAFGIYKILPILQNENPSSEEKYKEYVRESNNFYRNRQLSLQDIEQRKSTEVIESFQYGEKDNVPLFYTYVKTNKYFDINEVDSELFKLKQFINVEGIETNKIFALVHFFVNDKDNPYRSIMAEYSNIQREIKYKQVLITRPGKKLQINRWGDTAFRISMEVKDDHPNGILELSVFELQLDPANDATKLFAFDPMPTLVDSLAFTAFESKALGKENTGYAELYGMVNLVSKIVEGTDFNYRIPRYEEGIQYTSNATPVTPMYNWELTTSDNLAFIRIRSDDVKGYYLVDRESGMLVQAKASFVTEDNITRSFFFQWVPNS